MRDLNYQLKLICRHCREGRYATQAKRERMLALMANQLHELGYRGMSARSLKPKHIEALLGRWREQELTTGTIKNRMAAIRWWANKVDKRNVVARSNEHYGIPDRRFVTNESKAKTVTREQLEKVRTEQQREVLDRAHHLAGRGSLIPANRKYVQQMRVYEGNTRRAGLHHMHGLRHAYAQERYEELTGWLCPAAGGPVARKLTPEQRERDCEARLTISRELGHEREAVVGSYLGR